LRKIIRPNGSLIRIRLKARIVTLSPQGGYEEEAKGNEQMKKLGEKGRPVSWPDLSPLGKGMKERGKGRERSLEKNTLSAVPRRGLLINRYRKRRGQGAKSGDQRENIG